MGTDVHVLLFGGQPHHHKSAEDQIRNLEDRWSRFLPTSEISQLNNAPGELFVVSPDTFAVIKAAIDAWMLTDGLFDPTIEAAMMAAGYSKDYSEVERTTAVHPILGIQSSPTPEGVVLDQSINAVCLPEGVTLDLGGIGKGAAADMVASQLISDGVQGCVVNLGGDMKIDGSPPTSDGWPIDLEYPGADSQQRIHVERGAVCTSTKSKRVWSSTVGEQHHLRHPDDGSAAETGLQSVTVVCARALQGEVLAKAAFLAGRENAQEIFTKHGITGVMVHDDGMVEALEGFDSFTS